MQDFRFLNYNTEYSCKGEFEKEMAIEVCFSFVFGHLLGGKVSEEYEVILYRGVELAREEHKSNACLFTKQQVRNHLKQVQSIYPFTFYIKEEDWNRHPVFKVRLVLENVPGAFHKYILTWLRYTYEYPYNVILLDAYKLKRDSKFRFTSMSDLFNLVLSCFNGNPRDIHQIARNQVSKSLRKKEIREKLRRIHSLNNIYVRIKEKRKTSLIPSRIGDLTTYDIEYWEDDKLFEEYRKPIYMKVYQKIIKKQ